MATTNGSTFSEAQALTRAAPTAATEGQALSGFTGLTVVVEADSGQTLSGAGTLSAYIYDASTGAPGAWMRCPGLDLTVNLSGVRRMAFPAFSVATPRAGRVLFAATGVTVSSGTCTVYQLGQVAGGNY